MEAANVVDYAAEIYHCENEAEAQVIRDEVLAPNGVTGLVHDRSTHAFPTPATSLDTYFIAVEPERANEAADLIREARESGVISQHGAFTKR